MIGGQVLGDTRADTKRRQAAIKATKALHEVSKPAAKRKPALKRLGTMANTARVISRCYSCFQVICICTGIFRKAKHTSNVHRQAKRKEKPQVEQNARVAEERKAIKSRIDVCSS